MLTVSVFIAPVISLTRSPYRESAPGIKYTSALGIKSFDLLFSQYWKLILNVFTQKSSLPRFNLQIFSSTSNTFIMTITRRNLNYLDAVRFTFATRMEMFSYGLPVLPLLFRFIKYAIHLLFLLHTVHHNLYKLEDVLCYLYNNWRFKMMDW